MFRPYDFVQILPECGPNTYNVWRDLRLPMSASAMVTKMPDRENQVFAVNLPLKLFRATVASADIESQKSLHTFLKNVSTIC